MRGMGEVRFAGSLVESQALSRELSSSCTIKLSTQILSQSVAQHSTREHPSRNAFTSMQQDRKYIQWMQHTNITGAKRHNVLTQQLDSQPNPVPKERFGQEVCMICVCVCVYLHDCTLSKGEVFNKDIKTSVFIVEELPDPPVTHESRERLAGRQIQNTPLSFRTAR